MKSKFYFLAVAVIMVAVFSGCEKPEKTWLNEGSVTTDVASDVTINSAKLQGAVYPLEVEVTEMGFYYDTTQAMYSLQKVAATDGFSTVLTELEPNTTYYYYAYATAYGKTKDGDVKMFKTKAPTAPTVETLDAFGSTFKGNLTSDGGSTVTALGFVYGVNQNNLNQSIAYSSSIGIGGFSCTPSGLTNGNTYYYKAYAVNSVDTVYGAIKTCIPGKIAGHEYVDLGLPSGTLWATCNVGASSPQDYGTHTEKGTSVTWGGNWRTPTQSDLQELIGSCSSEWTTMNNINGRKFTGPNGKSIFLPAAGYGYSSGGSSGQGYGGYYWSSTETTGNNSSYTYYYYLYFQSGSTCNIKTDYYDRYSIRPCCPR